MNIPDLKKWAQSIDPRKLANEGKIEAKNYNDVNNLLVMIMDRCNRISEYTDKVNRWYDNIEEFLGRLKTMGVSFLKEEKKQDKTGVVPDEEDQYLQEGQKKPAEGKKVL